MNKAHRKRTSFTLYQNRKAIGHIRLKHNAYCFLIEFSIVMDKLLEPNLN